MGVEQQLALQAIDPHATCSAQAGAVPYRGPTFTAGRPASRGGTGMLRGTPTPTLVAALLLPLALQIAQLERTEAVPAQNTPQNIPVSQGHFAAYGEPYLAVNPRNPRNLLGAAQDIGACPAPGTFASFDGGRTWQDNGVLPVPPGEHCGGDVSVAFDAHGTGFVASHGGPSMFVDTVLVWRTGDGGHSFARPVIVYHDPHQQVDHAWLSVDATRGPHAGTLYLAWTASDPKDYPFSNRLLFSRSVDGGHHFSPPRVLLTLPRRFPAIPVISIGPEGAIHVFFAVGRRGQFPPVDPLLRDVVSSTDGGLSFGRPRPIAAEPVFLHLSGRNEFNIQAAATDPRDGTLYTAMAARRPASRHTDILLWRSRDAGRTWAGPVRVNGDAPTGDADHFQPQVAVTAMGIVYVSYFTLAAGRVDLYLSRSLTDGAGFSPGRRITSTSFDPGLSSEHREDSAWIGDYQGLATAPGVIHPFWNDTRTGHLAIFTANVPV
jgi:hypothetical protein